MVNKFNRVFRAVAILAGAMTYGISNAQTADIYPVPQSIQWSEQVAFNKDVAYVITGEDAADPDAVNLFKKNFSTDNGSVEVIIGERGDEAVAAYESLIPQKAEGYYLPLTAKRSSLPATTAAEHSTVCRPSSRLPRSPRL